MSLSTDRGRKVFVSCLMNDSCGTVVRHLINYFKMDGISAVIGRTEVGRGEPIDATLRRSIEDCDIYVIFFSENYATSNSRLWEVQVIAETAKAMSKRILPVFYGVTAEDVELKTNKYEMQLRQHTKESVVTVKEWRNALGGIVKILGLNRSTSDADLCQIIRGRVRDWIREKDHSPITLKATITGCPNLGSLEDLGLGSTSRTLLTVENCGIERLLLGSQPRNLTEKIAIRNCHNLKEVSIVHLNSLKELDIEGCASIESLSDVASLRKLKELSIADCPNLKVIEGFDEESGSLRVLNIHNCGSLESVDSNLLKIPRDTDFDYDTFQTLKHPKFSSCNSQDIAIISAGKPNKESERNNSNPTDSSSISTCHDEAKVETHPPESSPEDAEELIIEALDRLLELD